MSKLENEYSASLLASMIEHGIGYCSDGMNDCEAEEVAGIAEELKFLKEEQHRIPN
jgi:hypothetical protein